MATVNLTEVWLHDEDNHADYVRIKAATISEQATRTSEVRRYAGGRLRTITGPARPGTIQVTFDRVERDELAWLRERTGDHLMFRDPKSRVRFVSYGAIDVEEVPGRDWVQLSVTLREVSGTVEV